MAITKEQILAAADQIAAEGQRPTLESVRQITGGSYTTISPILNEWKAKQSAASAPLREPAPQAVADRLAEVGEEVWSIALGLANARLASEREALEKARAELEADRLEATELADRLAGQNEELQSQLVSALEAEKEARKAVETLQSQLTLAQEQAHTAEARSQEIERRADELRLDLDNARQQADQARQEVGQAREEAARLAGQIQVHQEQAAALLARINPTESKPTSTIAGAK